MYRATVRMNDLFKEWGTNWEDATTLKITQLFRLALVIGAESERFRDVASQYLKEGKSLPSPLWEGVEKWLWEDIRPLKEEGGRGHANDVAPSLDNGNARGTIEEGNGVLHGMAAGTDRGQDGETSRRLRKVRVGRPGERRSVSETIIFGSTERLGGTIRVLFD